MGNTGLKCKFRFGNKWMGTVVVLNTPEIFFFFFYFAFAHSGEKDRQTTTHKISNRIFISLKFVLSYY